MKKSKEFIYAIIVLILIIIILLISTCNGHRKNEELNNLLYSLNDTMQTYRNENGEHVAKISVLQTQNANDFLLIQSKDSTITKLQDDVRRYKNKINGGGSVTNISANTNVSGTTGSTISKTDTVYKDNMVYIYPTYDFKIDRFGKWVTGKGSSNKDSTSLEINVENEYTVAIGTEKRKIPGKLLKQKVPFVEVTNKNPYTETKSLRTYEVSAPRQKNFGVMVGIGYGGYFNPSTLKIGHGVQAGIMLGYQIIPIK